MWWWLLPLAPGVPESLVVGHERAFFNWFYDRSTFKRDSIGPGAVDEYLRTFSDRDGVLGAMGVYRAAFTTIEQTEPLTRKKVRVPVVVIGGEKGLGSRIRPMVEMVAENVTGESVSNCGHFVPEECPDEIVRRILAVTGKPNGR